MARKPKAQPNPDLPAPGETAVPARRGRKPKAAAPPPELPVTAGDGSPATDDAEADVLTGGSTKVPSRRGPGRKPKQAAGAEIALAVQDDAAGPQDQTSHQPEAEALPDLIEDDARAAAAATRIEAAADSSFTQPDLNPGRSADEAAQPSPRADAFAPAKPAAHWDRTTDGMQFDWPAIEQAAAQDSPNQGMAKLLLAARAEGAQSRWPF